MKGKQPADFMLLKSIAIMSTSFQLLNHIKCVVLVCSLLCKKNNDLAKREQIKRLSAFKLNSRKLRFVFFLLLRLSS